MRKILLLFLIINSINVFSQTSITPFTYDIKGVEASGDTVVVFGSLGAGMISFDNAESWETIQPFPSDNIARIFIEQDRLVAFSDVNKISISSDGGSSWKVEADYKDTINYIMSFNQNYYIRSGYSVFKINKELVKKIDLNFSHSFNNYNYYKQNGPIYLNNPNFYNSIVLYQNNIIALDSNLIYKLDKDLNILDSFEINNERIYSLYSGKNKLLVRTSEYIYDISNFKDYVELLNYKKKNEKLFGEDASYIRNLKIFNDNLYCLNSEGFEKKESYYHLFEIIDSTDANSIGKIVLRRRKAEEFFVFNDYTINNDKIICVAKNKLLLIYDLKAKKNEVIYDFWGINTRQDYKTIPINDSSFVYQIDNRESVFDRSIPKFYKTNDLGKTFERIENDTLIFDNNATFELREFDEKNNTLYYIQSSGLNAIFIKTSDFGNTVSIDTVYDFNVQGSTLLTNLKKLDFGYLLCKSVFTLPKYSFYYFLDEKFKPLKIIYDTTYTIIRASSRADNEIVSMNRTTEEEHFLQYTTNNGEVWNRIREFGGEDENDYFNDFISLKEISNTQGNYWLIYNYRESDSMFNIKLFDLESYEIDTLYRFKTDFSLNSSIATFVKEDTLHISIQDTIYKFSDISESSNLEKLYIPNKGYFAFDNLYKYGSRYLGLYSDSIRPLDLYWVTLDESGINSIEEAETERNYLYTLPPYPLPTQNEVKVQFYWDINLPMTIEDVSIYDINGREVQTKDKLRIDKQANHYGNLIWDCSGQQAGIYIINIKHGTEEKAVKVVVE